MRTVLLLATCLSLAFAPAFGLPARGDDSPDLRKIERQIQKEPQYQTKTPRYCLLVFGLDAKERVWLVQDGDTLYVDHNGNGDLTEPSKSVKAKQSDDNFRSFVGMDINVGGLKHTGLSVSQYKVTPDTAGSDQEWNRIKNSGAEPWMWWVRITAERATDDKRDLPKRLSYVINGDGQGMLLFASSPKDAPVIHINGPFTLGLQDLKQHFVPGEKVMFQIGIGPQGHGPGTFAFVLYPETIPATVFPEAEIVFPSRSQSQDPIRRKYVLKQRC